MKAVIQLSPLLMEPQKQVPPRLYTETELATYLRVCRRQLYNWRASGLIPYVKLGKSVRFRAEDVEAVLAANTIQHEPKP